MLGHQGHPHNIDACTAEKRTRGEAVRVLKLLRRRPPPERHEPLIHGAVTPPHLGKRVEAPEAAHTRQGEARQVLQAGGAAAVGAHAFGVPVARRHGEDGLELEEVGAAQHDDGAPLLHRDAHPAGVQPWPVGDVPRHARQEAPAQRACTTAAAEDEPVRATATAWWSTATQQRGRSSA